MVEGGGMGMDNRLNAKTGWMDTLLTITTMKDKNAKLTFITNFGLIVGNSYETVQLDITDTDALKASIEKTTAEGKLIDNLSLTDAFYAMRLSAEEKEGFQYDSVNLRIYVKDAKIFYFSDLKNPIDCALLTLFSDQIVGIIPGIVQNP